MIENDETMTILCFSPTHTRTHARAIRNDFGGFNVEDMRICFNVIYWSLVKGEEGMLDMKILDLSAA